MNHPKEIAEQKSYRLLVEGTLEPEAARWKITGSKTLPLPSFLFFVFCSNLRTARLSL
jgi:hypothetical protein